jgi:hypothetical protein
MIALIRSRKGIDMEAITQTLTWLGQMPTWIPQAAVFVAIIVTWRRGSRPPVDTMTEYGKAKQYVEDVDRFVAGLAARGHER